MLDADPATLDWAMVISPTVGGQDVIIAGTEADIVFGGTDGDQIWGNEGHDILFGDHALIDYRLPRDQFFLSYWVGAGDGGGDDVIHGDEDDDFILGGQGNDTLYGDDAQDDMTGGHNVPDGADGDDVMYGGCGLVECEDGPDAMLGDNGRITRTLTCESTAIPDIMRCTEWLEHDYAADAVDVVLRVIEIYNVETVSEPVAGYLYGDDDMWGQAGPDTMYGQGGEDEMWGGAGDDDMEGNEGSDYMEGNEGQDDMLGGTGPSISNDPGTALPGRVDESHFTREVPYGIQEPVEKPYQTEVVPLGDEMYGGPGADVMLGDNGIIVRPLTPEDGLWVTLTYHHFIADTGGGDARHPVAEATSSRVDREVQMVDLDPGRTGGSDLMYGGPGDDDMYGQFDDTADDPLAIGDEMHGEEGEDAMVGDLGVVDNWVVETETQYIRPSQPFFDDEIYITGSLVREVLLQEIYEGGDDRMTGGSEADSMHGGQGEDLMNGNAGNDRMFGDDGDDAMWGGLHHDHLWGGWGNDHLDVMPRPETRVVKKETYPPDPVEWFAWTEEDHYHGYDYAYGGWDQDALQANIADEGPVPGDRLMDWVGAYNVYYLCPGLYGEYVNTRSHSPQIIEFLQMLSQADGAVDTATPGSSGFVELAMVFPNEAGQNSHPPHPDTPGHFTCEESEVISKTVHTTEINLRAKGKKNTFMLTGKVVVLDGYSDKVQGATVYAYWTLPDGGSTAVEAATTNKQGFAEFTVSGGAGEYTLTVTNVEFEDYVWDAENSVIHGSMTVP
jgi:Ca2+-binding RTX toxin-like protein